MAMATLRPQVVLFGDSITEWSFRVDLAGWGASLVNYFARKADVVLRGFGGYNTRLAAQFLLEKIFPFPGAQPPPLLVTVFFGANDAADPTATHGSVHVPLEEYRGNLHKIVSHIRKQSDETRIILITPPPVSERMREEYQRKRHGKAPGVPTRRNELTKLYADECKKVAEQTDVPVIDLWSALQDQPDWDLKYLSDGLHLSAQGNAKVFDELMKVLAVDPALKADYLPWDFPPKNDFGANPTAALEKWCVRSHL
jgi:lysophospholipase L1-like esterase